MNASYGAVKDSYLINNTFILKPQKRISESLKKNVPERGQVKCVEDTSVSLHIFGNAIQRTRFKIHSQAFDKSVLLRLFNMQAWAHGYKYYAPDYKKNGVVNVTVENKELIVVKNVKFDQNSCENDVIKQLAEFVEERLL